MLLSWAASTSGFGRNHSDSTQKRNSSWKLSMLFLSAWILYAQVCEHQVYFLLRGIFSFTPPCGYIWGLFLQSSYMVRCLFGSQGLCTFAFCGEVCEFYSVRNDFSFEHCATILPTVALGLGVGLPSFSLSVVISNFWDSFWHMAPTSLFKRGSPTALKGCPWVSGPACELGGMRQVPHLSMRARVSFGCGLGWTSCLGSEQRLICYASRVRSLQALRGFTSLSLRIQSHFVFFRSFGLHPNLLIVWALEGLQEPF